MIRLVLDRTALSGQAAACDEATFCRYTFIYARLTVFIPEEHVDGSPEELYSLVPARVQQGKNVLFMK